MVWNVPWVHHGSYMWMLSGRPILGQEKTPSCRQGSQYFVWGWKGNPRLPRSTTLSTSINHHPSLTPSSTTIKHQPPSTFVNKSLPPLNDDYPPWTHHWLHQLPGHPQRPSCIPSFRSLEEPGRAAASLTSFDLLSTKAADLLAVNRDPPSSMLFGSLVRQRGGWWWWWWWWSTAMISSWFTIGDRNQLKGVVSSNQNEIDFVMSINLHVAHCSTSSWPGMPGKSTHGCVCELRTLKTRGFPVTLLVIWGMFRAPPFVLDPRSLKKSKSPRKLHSQLRQPKLTG